VGENQRQGLRALATLVHEVDAEAAHLGAELGEAIEPLLLLSPVEATVPVADQLFEVGEVGTLLPPRLGNLVGPSRSTETYPQVIEGFLANSHPKRLSFHVGAVCQVHRKGMLWLGRLGFETRS
jgi:hypothetical protein